MPVPGLTVKATGWDRTMKRIAREDALPLYVRNGHGTAVSGECLPLPIRIG